LNNNNNEDSSNNKISQPAEKRCTRTSSGKIVKKQKLNNEMIKTEETVKLGNSDSENEQLPRESWLLSSTKPIQPEETKGVVLRSSGRIPKMYKCECNTPKDVSTPPKITSVSKIKTPLTAPMTRILRSHKKKYSRRFKNISSRSSWPGGVVTRSHRRSVKC
jgi:hypothetical protein